MLGYTRLVEAAWNRIACRIKATIWFLRGNFVLEPIGVRTYFGLNSVSPASDGAVPMHDFTFSDLGRVLWGTTLKLALARGFAAGLVWAVITSFGPAPVPFETAVLWPVMWSVFALPLALITYVLAMVIGAIAPVLGTFLTVFGSLFVCAGDPLVYTLNRHVPDILNVADLGFFNLQPIVFVTYPD